MKAKKSGNQINLVEVFVVVFLVVLFGKPLFDLMLPCDRQCQDQKQSDKAYRDHLRTNRQAMQQEKERVFRESGGR